MIEPDWDSKSQADLIKITAINAWHSARLLKDIKNTLIYSVFALSMIIAALIHHYLTGSWL